MLTGTEPINGLTHSTILNFWSWAYSDILSNRNRGVFAEFIVATALGIHNIKRVEWSYVDLLYEGAKIEVKASSYVQSWEQKKHTSIKFDIGRKKGWNPDTNITSKESIRSADIYVFCLYAKDSGAIEDVINLHHWDFYLMKKEEIEFAFLAQKSVRLTKIKERCKAIPIQELRGEIDRLIKGSRS